MPGGEELIIADGRVKIRKNGEEQILEETSPKPPTEVDEYLDEFRIIKTDEKVLPRIDGDEDNQLTTILGKLKVIRNNVNTTTIKVEKLSEWQKGLLCCSTQLDYLIYPHKDCVLAPFGK
ncbi:5943_t:CDS:2 [Entrophospora sp. SA101]|nr:5943_t:CDS:2 [Entrophospora sp. SA101]